MCPKDRCEDLQTQLRLLNQRPSQLATSEFLAEYLRVQQMAVLTSMTGSVRICVEIHAGSGSIPDDLRVCSAEVLLSGPAEVL